MEILEKLNPNLLLVFEKITNDKNLAQDFSKYETGDELYEFCLKIKDGYSREEWEEFIRVLYLLTCKEKSVKILLNDNLSQVGGGTMFNNVKKKLLSGTLALWSIMPAASTFTPKALAAEPAVSSGVSSSSSKNLQRFKRIILGVGATVVVTAIGIYLYKKVVKPRHKNSNKNNDTANPEVKVEVNNLNQEVSNLKDSTVSSDSDNYREDVEIFPNGIRNPKNTCPINSTIQALYRIPNFREAIEKDTSGDSKVEAIKTMFKIIEKSESAVEPGALERAVKDLGYTGVQKDPWEVAVSLKPIMEKYGMPNALVEVFSIPTQEKSPLSMQRILSGNDSEIITSEVDKKDKYFMVGINRVGYAPGGVVRKLKFAVDANDVADAQLMGAIVHGGEEVNSGHFVFLSKEKDGWYVFDDDKVKKISAEQAEKGFIYAKGNINGMSRNGVLYLYERI